MVRNVSYGHFSATVHLNAPVARFPANPILTAADVNLALRDPALQVVTVHNAGVTRHNDETVMLFRSHLRCGKSILGIARSSDGVGDWRIDPHPALSPATKKDHFAGGVDSAAQQAMEAGGVEDPRIMYMGGTYAVTYNAYDAKIKNRVRVCLAVTEDFTHFVRYGPILEQDMRNVVLFPETFGGRYAGLFRPNDDIPGDTGGTFTQICIGYADDWRGDRWEISERPIMRTGMGPSAFSDKIGPGAPPFRTAQGWLNLFHGVRTTMDGNPYVLGVALHDLHDPSRVKMSSIPILFPTAADCRVSASAYVHVPGVVFTCGALCTDDGTVLVYYGGNDTVMNIGFSHVDVLVALCERYGQDPYSGSLLYTLGH
ncbi:MAG: glycosidase [Chitinivibrionales bacterium]|nr:glycosidase [Chitinivibrionales bacterium]MBD3358468.1 glycosidase [Chitinivibrionales bacterium]